MCRCRRLSNEVEGDISIPVYRVRDNEPTEVLRARLLYQSRKRGMLENGLLLRCALISVCIVVMCSECYVTSLITTRQTLIDTLSAYHNKQVYVKISSFANWRSA